MTILVNISAYKNGDRRTVIGGYLQDGLDSGHHHTFTDHCGHISCVLYQPPTVSIVTVIWAKICSIKF